LKNVAVATPLLFSGNIFVDSALRSTGMGFIVFCLLSSSGYLLNDILDAPKDRNHPFKRFRPIASGDLPIPVAFFVSVAMLVTGLFIAITITPSFFLLSALFVILQYSYSLIFKHISVIDILAITTAYFLRVYAGEAAIGYHISIWLSLAAVSLALFLAIGKRRAELTLLGSVKKSATTSTRDSLSHYSEKLLDTYTAMFANSTFLTYAFYTFLEKPINRGFLFTGYGELATAVSDRKWMMVTIPFVLFGIMRYMQLIYEGKGESPEKLLTSDMSLILTIVAWIGSVFFVIYGIGG